MIALGPRLATAWVLVRRRLRLDAGLLLLTAVLVLASAALITAVPRVVAQASDEALQRAVAEQPWGSTQIEAQALPSAEELLAVDIAQIAGDLHEAAGATLRAATRATTAVAVSPQPNRIETASGTPAGLRLTLFTDPPPVRYAGGRAPRARATTPFADPGDRASVEFAVSSQIAREFDLTVGERLPLLVDPETERPSVTGVVSGIFEAVDRHDQQWGYALGVFEPFGSANEPPVGTALVAPDAVTDLVVSIDPAVDASIEVTWRLVPVADRFRAADTPALIDEARRLLLQSDQAFAGFLIPPTTRSGLPEMLEEFVASSRPVRAQLSVVLAGVAAAAALVLVLAAGLLADRRRTALTLERARGAAFPVTAARLAVEAAIVVVPAVAAGYWLGSHVGAPVPPSPPLLAALALVAVAAACRRCCRGCAARSVAVGVTPPSGSGGSPPRSSWSSWRSSLSSRSADGAS